MSVRVRIRVPKGFTSYMTEETEAEATVHRVIPSCPTPWGGTKPVVMVTGLRVTKGQSHHVNPYAPFALVLLEHIVGLV